MDEIKGLVSIIIPSYNYAGYVKEAINSCLSQTYGNNEIILVDDGSTDGTARVLDDYIRGGRIKYIYKNNGGLSSARNAGLIKAKGEFVQFLDADDILDPEKLEKQVSVLNLNPGVFGSYSHSSYFINSTGKSVRTRRETVNGDIMKRLIRWNFIPVLAMLTRRSGILFDESLKSLEDWDYWLHMFHGRRVVCVPEILCHVRIHQTNMSRDIERMIKSEILVLDKMAGEGIMAPEASISKFVRLFPSDEGWKDAFRQAVRLDKMNFFRAFFYVIEKFCKMVLRNVLRRRRLYS